MKATLLHLVVAVAAVLAVEARLLQHAAPGAAQATTPLGTAQLFGHNSTARPVQAILAAQNVTHANLTLAAQVFAISGVDVTSPAFTLLVPSNQAIEAFAAQQMRTLQAQHVTIQQLYGITGDTRGVLGQLMFGGAGSMLTEALVKYHILPGAVYTSAQLTEGLVVSTAAPDLDYSTQARAAARNLNVTATHPAGGNVAFVGAENNATVLIPDIVVVVPNATVVVHVIDWLLIPPLKPMFDILAPKPDMALWRQIVQRHAV